MRVVTPFGSFFLHDPGFPRRDGISSCCFISWYLMISLLYPGKGVGGAQLYVQSNSFEMGGFSGRPFF